MLISVVNLAQPKIADAELQQAIRAINIPIAEDFAPYWQFGTRLRLEGPVGRKPDRRRLEEIRADAILMILKPDQPAYTGFDDSSNCLKRFERKINTPGILD